MRGQDVEAEIPLTLEEAHRGILYLDDFVPRTFSPMRLHMLSILASFATMSIDNARFRKPVVPGDRVEYHVVKQKQRGNIWKFHCDAKVDGQLVAVEENRLVFRKVLKMSNGKFVSSVENKPLRKYSNMEVVQGQGEEVGVPVFYLVQREAIITGRDLKNARAVLSWLEAHGRRTVNGRRILELEMSKVDQLWDQYGNVPSALPPELADRHKRVYAEAIARARARGWDAELDDND